MTIVLYWWLDCWQVWLDVDYQPRPPPRKSAEIVNLAQWREDHAA
jgi:hypothetical protein